MNYYGKIREIKKINGKIKSQRTRGVRESTTLDKLLNERHELEWDICRKLNETEKIPNPLMDYCFKHLVPAEKKESVLDKISLVEKFTKDVQKTIGQKILYAQGNNLKVGTISGKCVFKIEENEFRNLYVPVKELKTFDYRDTNKWKNKGDGSIFINDDIFKYDNKFSRSLDDIFVNAFTKFILKDLGCSWKADYSNTRFIGGPGPKNIYIYLGDKLVENKLKEGFEFEIPSRRIRIPED